VNLDLSGKHALVCGASRGIGRATAIALARLGADVTLLARSAAALEAARSALPRPNATQRHTALAVDMNELAVLRSRVEALVQTQPVQILINNSGGPPAGPAHTATPEEYLRAFQQHVLAAQILVQAVLPGMRGSGYGRIVNVISTSVKEPIRNLGVSNTVRGAMASWAKTLAGELGPFGITVNNVLPGYTETDRLQQLIRERARAGGQSEESVGQALRASVPLGRFAAADEVAAAIAFLASPAASYIHGVSLPVDGGRIQSL
jgi:3-oxoacyl-[acyl-carrier protein] reductase